MMNDNAGNLVIPKKTGYGVKVDTEDPRFGWKDLLGVVQTRGSGLTVPGFNVYRGNIRQYQFSISPTAQEAYFEFHAPHDLVPGSNMYIHAHWSQNVGTLTSGGVSWDFEISYAHGYERGAFSSPITLTAAYTPTVKAQYEHYISEILLATPGGTGGVLDASNIEVDGIFLVRCVISANTLSPAADPFLHYVDIHYQSTQMATKNKNYPFYLSSSSSSSCSSSSSSSSA